ncbi:MAG: helix-turn-helix domain-containing protein [Rubrobacteraceae bacterium]|nr:helix-turn-helix domain-containing protein [Rubrobacteraceae bacterium]
MEEHYLSLSEAAGALGISERTAHRWIKSGKLRSYKPGRDHKIPESAIIEAIEAGEVRPKAQAPPSPEQPSFNGLLEEERREAETAEMLISFGERMVARFDSELKGRAEAEDLEWFDWAQSMYEEYIAILNTVQGRGVSDPQGVLASLMDMNASMQALMHRYEEVGLRAAQRSSSEAREAPKAEEKAPR